MIVDYSYRNLDIGQFAQMFKKCVQEDNDKFEHGCRGDVMQAMMHAESGRFEEMVNDVHRQVSALDPDEREMFAENNPGLMARAKEWGVIQEAGMFKDVDTPHDDKIPSLGEIRNPDESDDGEGGSSQEFLDEFNSEPASDLPGAGGV